MDEVAAEAQFTKRTVYMYFVDKEDLLFAVALEGSKRLFARQQAILAEDGTGLAKVRRAAQAYYEFSRDSPDLFRLIEDARRRHVRRAHSGSRDRRFASPGERIVERRVRTVTEGLKARDMKDRAEIEAFDTWLGALVGIVLYVASRLFSPAEEGALAQAFGPAWDAYIAKVKLPWL